MNRNGDFLKFTAMLTMLIDHIGYLFFPSVIWWRVIGRLSFPIFAFLIARGYRRTHDLKKYALRLFFFGLVSQVPYMYFVQGRWNIMFTLLLGLFSISLYESKWKPLGLAVPLLALVLPVSYGVYGVAMILVFHMTYDHADRTMLAFFVLNGLEFWRSGNTIQALSVFALFPILLDLKTPIRVPRLVGYLFYPVHIAVLLWIRTLL